MIQAMQKILSQPQCKGFCLGDIVATHIHFMTSVSFAGKSRQWAWCCFESVEAGILLQVDPEIWVAMAQGL
jgi:hypothetical protein